MKQLIPVRLSYKNIPFDAKDGYPMAQEIAKPMHKEFIERGFIDK